MFGIGNLPDKAETAPGTGGKDNKCYLLAMPPMPRILVRTLCWAALPVLAVAAAAMASELFQAIRIRAQGAESLLHPAVLALAGGFGFRLLLRMALARMGREDPLEFIDTLEHELTHALMGYLTLSPPVSLSATLKSGGEVELKGSNPLAALAPYFLPLWCLIALIIGMVVRPGTQGAWNVLVFALLGAYAYRLGHEFRWRQTDLHLYGFTFSLLTIAVLLTATVGIILHARGLVPWNWMADALPEARNMLGRAWEALGNLRRPG